MTERENDIEFWKERHGAASEQADALCVENKDLKLLVARLQKRVEDYDSLQNRCEAFLRDAERSTAMAVKFRDALDRLQAQAAAVYSSSAAGRPDMADDIWQRLHSAAVDARKLLDRGMVNAQQPQRREEEEGAPAAVVASETGVHADVRRCRQCQRPFLNVPFAQVCCCDGRIEVHVGSVEFPEIWRGG